METEPINRVDKEEGPKSSDNKWRQFLFLISVILCLTKRFQHNNKAFWVAGNFIESDFLISWRRRRRKKSVKQIDPSVFLNVAFLFSNSETRSHCRLGQISTKEPRDLGAFVVVRVGRKLGFIQERSVLKYSCDYKRHIHFNSFGLDVE